MSRRDSFDDLLDDLDSNNAFKAYSNARRTNMNKANTKNHMAEHGLNAVEGLLRTTNIPYVVIGGQAASKYATLSHAALSNENTLLVSSTIDYDLMVKATDHERFLEALLQSLACVIPTRLLHERMNDDLNIHIIGFKQGDMVESLVDLHIVPKLPPSVRLDGIRYARIDWLEEELRRTVHMVNSEWKGLKRQKRLNVLSKMDLARSYGNKASN